MRQPLYHGILVDVAFTSREFPRTFPLFAYKKAGEWGLYGIQVARKDLETAIQSIRGAMRADAPFYAHLYDDEQVIVIFKERVFRVTSHASRWDELRRYGLTLGIPLVQLDLWPNRFQDEIHYFTERDFLVPPA